MTSHPPSGSPSVPPSGPPTGPPSGPLSGPRPGAPPAGPPPSGDLPRPGTGGPPSGPPYDGPGGGGGGGGGGGDGGGGGGRGGRGGSSRAGGPSGGGGGPWWRSVPKIASLTAVLVAVAALAVVLANRPDDKGGTAGGSGEVFLQNAAASGPDPFTRSTARTDAEGTSAASLPPRTGAAETATPRVSGSAPGLYGGTRSTASCDVEQQVRHLSADPAKNQAFASVLRLRADQVPGYLRSLTPLQLRVDTRVTNHGYRAGSATPYQAVLQAGTAVLVDSRGVPRVRCACGNPLTEPVPQKAPRTTGTPWQDYRANQVVVVAPSVTVVNVFVVYDPERDSWFARRHGDTGRHDKPTPPPPRPTPTTTSPSPSSSTPTDTPTPCVTVTGKLTPTPHDGVTPTPCPSSLSPTQTTPTPSTSSATPSDDTTSPRTPSDTPTDPTDGTDTTTPSEELTTDGTTSADTPTETTTDESTTASTPATRSPITPPGPASSSVSSPPAPGPAGAPVI